MVSVWLGVVERKKCEEQSCLYLNPLHPSFRHLVTQVQPLEWLVADTASLSLLLVAQVVCL